MHRGYVKVWRKSLDSGWLHNPNLWTFWCWCLLKASHREMDMMVGLQKVHLMPGDFIFGRKAASMELKISEQTIRTNLDSLRKHKNLTIKATNKFSVISIMNWNIYQGEEIEDNQQTNQQLTNKQPTTNQQLTTNKNVKNEKNEKNKPIEGPVGVNTETWNAFIEMRKTMKAPLTTFSAKLIIDKLVKLSNDNGGGMEMILQQSIANNWKGVFPLKDGNYGSGSFGGAGKVVEKAGRAKSDGTPYPIDHEF